MAYLKTMAAGLIAGAMTVGTQADAKILRAETAGAGGLAYTVMILTAKSGKEKYGLNLQVSDGEKLVMAMLRSGLGRVDIYSGYPPAYRYMQKGIAMYKRMGERARKASKNLRAMFAYPAGMYMPIVFADSGIKSWKDFKGKRILTGPAAGAATKDNRAIITAMTGYQAGKDYTEINLAWGQGEQAMRDGQVDVYMKPSQIGAAAVQQIARAKPIRIFGFTDADLRSNPKLAALTRKPAVTVSVLPKGSFENQVNGDKDMKLVAYVLFEGTRKGVPADVIYKLTKAFWETLAEAQKSTPILRMVTKDKAFVSLEMPLHLGAYRYYKEAGFKIPAKLVPPEAK